MLVPCAKYCMLSNANGVHWGSSCPQCSRRPKHILRAVSLCGNAQFQSRTKTNESWCFLRGHGRAEGLSLKKFFCTRHKHPSPPLSMTPTIPIGRRTRSCHSIYHCWYYTLLGHGKGNVYYLWTRSLVYVGRKEGRNGF